jgi:hypothetical protein
MRIEVEVRSKRDGFGTDRFEPKCPITRAVAEAEKSGCINKKYLKSFIENGLTLEYSGRRCELLDQMGAIYSKK